MANITTCSKCGLLYEELSREAADEPGHVCSSCWREGWRPDGIGGIYNAVSTTGRVPVGARCIVQGVFGGTVVRHGRDATGVYTEVLRDDGHTERYHRSLVRAAGDAAEAMCHD